MQGDGSVGGVCLDVDELDAAVRAVAACAERVRGAAGRVAAGPPLGSGAGVGSSAPGSADPFAAAGPVDAALAGCVEAIAGAVSRGADALERAAGDAQSAAARIADADARAADAIAGAGGVGDPTGDGGRL